MLRVVNKFASTRRIAWEGLLVAAFPDWGWVWAQGGAGEVKECVMSSRWV